MDQCTVIGAIGALLIVAYRSGFLNSILLKARGIQSVETSVDQGQGDGPSLMNQVAAWLEEGKRWQKEREELLKLLSEKNNVEQSS